MEVTMTKATYFDGMRLKKGDSVSVDEVTAKRWTSAGIAKTGDAKAATSAEKPLEKMKTEELVEKAAELGVDISQAGTNKEKAAAIQAFIDQQAENKE